VTAGGQVADLRGHVRGQAVAPATATDADLGFPLIPATVAPAPDNAYAATQYRRH
jgi:hypothetical protein